MEKILNTVIRSTAHSIGGLILGSLITSVIIGLAAQAHESITLSGIKSGYGVGIFASFFAIMAGFIPVLFYGAPMYALTCLCGRASFLFSALIGVIPGAALYIFNDKTSGFLFIIFGLAVGLSTHAIAKATERK